MGRLDPVSRVIPLDRKQARDLVCAHPSGSAHPSGPDGHGVSECEHVGCHTLLLGRALLRAARAPEFRLFLSLSAKERRCAACPKRTGRPRASRSTATRWGVPPALHAAGFLPNARSILGLEAPSSTAYKRRARERLAHGDDLIRRAGLVLPSVL